MEMFGVLSGWRQIAAALGRSEWWCRRLASEDTPADRRLPVYYVAGIPAIDLPSIRAWLDGWRVRREGRKGVARPRAGAAKRVIARHSVGRSIIP